MRKTFATLVLAVCVVHPATIDASDRSDRAAIQKQIERSELAIIEAIFRNDSKTFLGLVVSDSLIASGEGIVKVSEFVPLMNQTAAQCKFNKVESSEHTFYWFNDTTLVHIYKTKMDATCDGKPIPMSLSSSVWVKQRWKVAGSVSPRSEGLAPPSPKKWSGLTALLEILASSILPRVAPQSGRRISVDRPFSLRGY